MWWKASCTCGNIEYQREGEKPAEMCGCGSPRRVIALTDGEYLEEVARTPGEILCEHLSNRGRRIEKVWAKAKKEQEKRTRGDQRV